MSGTKASGLSPIARSSIRGVLPGTNSRLLRTIISTLVQLHSLGMGLLRHGPGTQILRDTSRLQTLYLPVQFQYDLAPALYMGVDEIVHPLPRRLPQLGRVGVKPMRPSGIDLEFALIARGYPALVHEERVIKKRV